MSSALIKVFQASIFFQLLPLMTSSKSVGFDVDEFQTGLTVVVVGFSASLG
jgi:hypothetical protein